MGVLDKFLDMMKIGDDDYDDNDDFFDDDDDLDDYDDKPRKGGMFKKDKDLDDEDDFDDVPTDRNKPVRSAGNKVTPMRQPVRRASAPSMEVCVIKPNSVENARDITETLLEGRTVILNLEGLDLEIAQRIIDFTSGAAFAIDGNLQKISNYIFLVTPTNVEISGDLQDLLNSSFDVPSIKNRF
ncbi:MAG TPA: cell division protein SepF [Lachnospiraceae bacterium]|nr:cell division protein SepF [Lachnospiraceae bacterium]